MIRTMFLLLLALAGAQQFTSVQLKTQNLDSPTVDTNAGLQFSWVPVGSRRNITVESHRIVVQELFGTGSRHWAFHACSQ